MHIMSLLINARAYGMLSQAGMLASWDRIQNMKILDNHLELTSFLLSFSNGELGINNWDVITCR